MIRKLVYAMSFIVMLLISNSTVWGQLKFMDIIGSGARAEGMGGAFIGVADDATALSWNPAGLTQLERPEASFVFRQSMDKYSYSAPGDKFSSTASHPTLNFGSFAYPMKFGENKFTVALAFQNQIDLFLYTNQKDVFKEDQTGGINSISPGLAYQIMPALSVGASFNLWLGSSEYKYDDLQDNSFSYSYKDDFSGFNYQVGVLADLEQTGVKLPMRIGVSYRAPFEMTDKWKYGGSSTEYKWAWQLPAMFGFGISYRVGENLTLAADYEMRKFGGSKVKQIDDPSNPGESFNLSSGKDDLNPIRIGAEYLVITDNWVIPVRAGFKTVPTLFADVKSNGDFGSQVTGTAISVGSGIILKRFAIDIAATRRAFEVNDKSDDSKKEFTYLIFSGSAIIYF